VTTFLEGEGVRWRGKTYRYQAHPDDPEESCLLTDLRGKKFFAYKSEIEGNLAAEVEIIRSGEAEKQESDPTPGMV
jgi:hypothetical protein